MAAVRRARGKRGGAPLRRGVDKEDVSGHNSPVRFYRTFTKFIWLVVVALAVTGLAGCGGPLPTPPLATAVATPDATAEASPAGPVLTPAVTATQTLTPTPSDTPTPTYTPTLTPTATLTPTPSPTLPPSVQFEAALRDQTNGDYEQAIAGLLAVLAHGPSPEQAREAQYHLAELYALKGDSVAAASEWEKFIAVYPDDARMPRAHLAAARAFDALEQCGQAIGHYEASLAGDPILGDMVYEWIGDCHQANGELELAVASYRKGLALTKDLVTQAGLREKIATVYLAVPNYPAALAEFDAILAIARTEATRARMEYMAGETLVVLGEADAAYARYRRAVSRYPGTGSAYLSLIRLVDAGEPVDEFQRGLVDYYAGANSPDAYGASLAAFDRYLAEKPAPRADEALYYKALIYQAQGQPQDALDALDLLIQNHPKSAWLAKAWIEKGKALASAGDADAAVKAYQDTAAYFPADPLAPQALWSAAKLREGAGAYEQAAALFEELQTGFPAYEDAAEALWRAGLGRYRNAARDEAKDDWQALVTKYPGSSYRDAGLYWLGKLGDKASWDRLVELDPHSYYALRVQQIRDKGSLTASRLVVDAIEPPAWDAKLVESEVLRWVRDWTQVPAGTSLIDLPESLANRQDYQQGKALLAAGLRREALAAFDGARSAAWNNPLALAQLSIDFHEQGLYGLAARCASRLVGLWPGGVVQDAPGAVQRLAYPLVYTDLLSADAKTETLDPLLLAAVIRQESLFEPVAESYAGARGLGQVMPATGEGIARSLGMEGFTLDDLYRPSVSVRFCAFYLAVQMKRFDNQILVALAAYHGGPGNTISWLEAAGDDLDLFVEVLTAPQSRIYLQRVYEQYITYEGLYR
jgi:soluble lytic murein transglycosylase